MSGVAGRVCVVCDLWKYVRNVSAVFHECRSPSPAPAGPRRREICRRVILLRRRKYFTHSLDISITDFINIVNIHLNMFVINCFKKVRGENDDMQSK